MRKVVHLALLTLISGINPLANAVWIDAATGEPVYVTPYDTTVDAYANNTEAQTQTHPNQAHVKGHNLFWDKKCKTWKDVKTGNEVYVTPYDTTVDAYANNTEAQTRIHPNQAHVKGHNLVWVPCPEETTSSTTGPVKAASSSLFRTGEVQLNLFGGGGVGHGQVNVTDTVSHTETVSMTSHTTETVLRDIPGKPGLTPVDVVVPVTTQQKEKKPEHVTRNKAAIQGGFGGLGADAKYFVTQNIGLGVQGDWLDGAGNIGTIFGTVTARFPKGSNAPYLLGGAGVQFGDRTEAVGELGGGIEHRFSPSCGVFTDASWMFASHENAAVFRLGVSLVFGPQELPPPTKK